MSRRLHLFSCFSVALLAAVASLVSASGAPQTVPIQIEDGNAFTHLRSSNRSGLYQMNQSTPGNQYAVAPYLIRLAGTRFQIGYDYANLMAEETSATYDSFMQSVLGSATDIAKMEKFDDFLWDSYYIQHIPQEYLDEFAGMDQWCSDFADRCSLLKYTPRTVNQRFLVLANMPADKPNILAALEREIERGWPAWLKDIVNDIIRLIEKLGHKCDSYGVWGSRTAGGTLYTSRNLDYSPNTGINQYKLIQVFNIVEASGEMRKYAAYGFSFGLGALAGQNIKGITTSEMNLDNNETTFSGLPFPTRLRYVLERANDLQSAMQLWNSTNNTNSFNFLIGSAADGAAYALETIYNFTAVFPADSPIEAAATYNCGLPPNVDPTCAGWTWNLTTGRVPIGYPLPEAVWRTNHGVNPRVMATQEPLFNDTVFRYRLMHTLFAGFGDAGIPIGDREAVGIVATLGTKGQDYYVCDPSQYNSASNVMSIAYVPGSGRAYVAWEDGSGDNWRPAACAPYLHINLTQWW